MKRLNKPNSAGRRDIPKILILVGTGLLLNLMTSCTQDNNSLPTIENVGEPVAVSIIPSGIALYGSVTETDESGSTRSIDTKKERVHFLEDFDEENMLETIIESVPEEVAVPTRAVNLTNTTMRVVVCNSTGDMVAQCAYNITDGTATPQDGEELIVPNSSSAYTFHCYSPANTIDSSTKKVTVNAGENFAYNKVTQVVASSTGAATVTIPTLTPMMSKIKYSVSSTAFAGTITCTGSVKGTFATGATADWTLGDAVLTSTTAADQLLEFTENNQELTVFSTGATTGELTLTIADLTIGDETKTAPTLTAASGFTLEAGKLYTISIAIKPHPYINVAGTSFKVARGNLMYTEGKWHLAPDQGWYSDSATGGDLFCWGRTDPTYYGSFGGNMNALNAACVEVLGEGWRIPSSYDFKDYFVAKPRVWGSYTSIRGKVEGWYIGTSDVNEAEANSEKYVFLPLGHWRGDEGHLDTGRTIFFKTPSWWSTHQWWYATFGGYQYGVLYILPGTTNELAYRESANYDQGYDSPGYYLRCVSN